MIKPQHGLFWPRLRQWRETNIDTPQLFWGCLWKLRPEDITLIFIIILFIMPSVSWITNLFNNLVCLKQSWSASWRLPTLCWLVGKTDTSLTVIPIYWFRFWGLQYSVLLCLHGNDEGRLTEENSNLSFMFALKCMMHVKPGITLD